MPLLIRVEALFARKGPFLMGFWFFAFSCALCTLALVVDVASVRIGKPPFKEIGYFYSASWSVGSLLFVPLFIGFAAAQARSVNKMLTEFADRGVITTPTGERVKRDLLAQRWAAVAAPFTFIVLFFLLLASGYIGWHWWSAAAVPLIEWELGDRVLGWGNAAIILDETDARKVPLLMMTGVAFGYNAVIFFVFAVMLAHSACFAWFLSTISSEEEHSTAGLPGPASLRFVFKRDALRVPLADFYWRAFVLTILGMCTFILVRVHVAFLSSAEPDVVTFLFRSFAAAPIAIGPDHPLAEVIALLRNSNATAVSMYIWAACSFLCIAWMTGAFFGIMKDARSEYVYQAGHDLQWFGVRGMPTPTAADLAEIDRFGIDLSFAPYLWITPLLLVGLGIAFVSPSVVTTGTTGVCFLLVYLIRYFDKRVRGRLMPAEAAT